MNAQYRTVYEADGQWWISKPNNGGELLPSDVVGELNRLQRQVEAAKNATELVKGPLNGEIERLRYALKIMGGTAVPRPRVCDDPHHCTFSDCPTAFCDRAGRPDGWIPAGRKPNGHERRVLCWVVWPGRVFSEPIVGWWKHGPGCFAVEDVENADHLVTHWKEIGEPAL